VGPRAFVLVACLAACTREAGPAPPPAPTTAPPQVDVEVRDAAATAERIARQDTITCPPGTSLRGQPPPAGHHAWCEDIDGSGHGPWMVWPGSGAPRKIAIYDHDKLNGTWTQWHAQTDTLAEHDEWAGGVRHGRSLNWHANGRLAAIGTFERGAPRGRFRAWDAAGALLFDQVIEAPGGVITTWDDDRRVEETWRDGGMTGPRRVWYDDRQLESVTEFKDGLPHGPFESWYPDGRKRSEGVSANGMIVSQTEWDERGEVIPPMCAHGPCDMPPE
jgi:antitoxin component YwqK of YwqJK toxin-antitoxin module